MAQSYLRNPSVERLPMILEELHNRSLCIPPFQRDFEWNGKQRLALCSSVRMGLPTGSLLVWRTSRPLASENPIGPYLLDAAGEGARQYLLDGRQRMTTLYAAMAESFWTRNEKKPPAPEPPAMTAPDGTPWEIWFDLASQEFVFPPDAEAAERRRPPPSKAGGRDKESGPPLLPLGVLLDDAAYDDWRSSLPLTREQVNRARALRSAFMDYMIPIVPLVTDDIAVVTLTFKRINNGGTPMGDADMARALAWTPRFDLRKHLDAVREHLMPLGWGNLDEDILLKVVAAVSALDPFELDPERLADHLKTGPAVVELAGERVVQAAAILGKRLGIAGPGALPYAQILVFTARALHEAGGRLTPVQENKLVGWIAEVCISERFGNAPEHMIKADWRALAHRLGLPISEPPRTRDDRTANARECWRFSMAWARSRATALVLAGQGPRDARGEPLLDPSQLVARGSEGVGMLVAEGADGLPPSLQERLSAMKDRSAGFRSPANRVVCPPAQLPELRRALFKTDCPGAILQSHLIDPRAHAALVREALDDFFEHRRTAIFEAEKRWVQARGGKVQLHKEPRDYARG